MLSEARKVETLSPTMPPRTYRKDEIEALEVEAKGGFWIDNTGTAHPVTHRYGHEDQLSAITGDPRHLSYIWAAYRGWVKIGLYDRKPDLIGMEVTVDANKGHVTIDALRTTREFIAYYGAKGSWFTLEIDDEDEMTTHYLTTNNLREAQAFITRLLREREAALAAA